jgi:lipopolysaccharide biosynthesis glycosyltransferase
MLRIFIGWDSRFPEPADVLRYSLVKHASIPLEIHYLKLDELQLSRAHDPLASTEFTYSRFLVPHLCNFRGKALFLDNDMLCFGDVKQLDQLDMTGLALRVVKHDYEPTNSVKMYGAVQTSYPRKNWSSMMLMDCAKLRLWSKEVVETQTGAYLHRFQDLPDEQIGDIPKTWNTLDWMDDYTKLIHYTNGGPWFPQYANHPHAAVWYAMRDEMDEATRTAVRMPYIAGGLPTGQNLPTSGKG